MLKIKDNVDLKELEKFGFKYFNNGSYKIYEIDNWNSWIGVELKDRIIQIGVEDYKYIEENVLFDLIKADLVEKVEDKK